MTKYYYLCQQDNGPFIYAGQFVHTLTISTLDYIEDGVVVVENGKIAAFERTSQNLADLQTQFEVSYVGLVTSSRLRKSRF